MKDTTQMRANSMALRSKLRNDGWVIGKLFADAITKQINEAGISEACFFRNHGLKNFHPTYSYLRNGKRGMLSLWKACEIANKLGINLSEIQKKYAEKVIWNELDHL